MSLLTRQNPDNGTLELLVDDQWVSFEEYRNKQIADAYDKSVKFLRDRLGADTAQKELELLDGNNLDV